MIDKSSAERAAILAGKCRDYFCHVFIGERFNVKPEQLVWPNAFIRICQFHIIQAITRWEVDAHPKVKRHKHRKKGKKGKKNTSNSETGTEAHNISEPLLVDILDCFRTIQRCRDTPSDPFAVAEQKFNAEVRAACIRHEREDRIRPLIAYFKDNWFCDQWRGMWSKFRSNGATQLVY